MTKKLMERVDIFVFIYLTFKSLIIRYAMIMLLCYRIWMILFSRFGSENVENGSHFGRGYEIFSFSLFGNRLYFMYSH